MQLSDSQFKLLEHIAKNENLANFHEEELVTLIQYGLVEETLIYEPYTDRHWALDEDPKVIDRKYRISEQGTTLLNDYFREQEEQNYKENIFHLTEEQVQENKKANKISRKSLVVAIIALAVSILSLVLTLYFSIPR